MLIGVTIRGGITVEAGSSLYVEASEIRGSIMARSAGGVYVEGSVVRGGVTVAGSVPSGALPVAIIGAEVRGDLVVAGYSTSVIRIQSTRSGAAWCSGRTRSTSSSCP